MALVETFLGDVDLAVELPPSARSGRRCRRAYISMVNGVTSPLDEQHDLRLGVLDVLRLEVAHERHFAAVEHERHRQLRPQRVLLEQAIGLRLDPFELLIVENVEAIAGLGEHDAVVAALHQRFLVQQIDHAAKPTGLLLDLAVVAERPQRQRTACASKPMIATTTSSSSSEKPALAAERAGDS